MEKRPERGALRAKRPGALLNYCFVYWSTGALFQFCVFHLGILNIRFLRSILTNSLMNFIDNRRFNTAMEEQSMKMIT